MGVDTTRFQRRKPEDVNFQGQPIPEAPVPHQAETADDARPDEGTAERPDTGIQEKAKPLHSITRPQVRQPSGIHLTSTRTSWRP